MSQTVNAETSSNKRIYRKGNPLTLAERQQASIARKRATHKEIRVFLPNALKEKLQSMCKESGITQAEMLAKLIEQGIICD